MICQVYEPRPRTTRTVTDPRAATPVDKIEFASLGRHHLDVAEVVRIAEKRGYKLASTPNAVQSPDIDLVLYVEPLPAASPREAFEAARARGQRKRKTVAISGGLSKKLTPPRV